MSFAISEEKNQRVGTYSKNFFAISKLLKEFLKRVTTFVLVIDLENMELKSLLSLKLLNTPETINYLLGFIVQARVHDDVLDSFLKQNSIVLIVDYETDYFYL